MSTPNPMQYRPQFNGTGIMNRDELLQKYGVLGSGWSAVRQSLYDYQAYPAAGTPLLQFFAVPAGQGGKTLSDTNMTLAGQLPAGQVFLVESIEFHVFPTVPAVAADNPAAYGAGAVAAQINDAYVLYRTGNLQFTVLTTTYTQEAPLGRFPPKVHFDLSAAASDASTAAASQSTRIAFAWASGRPYLLAPCPVGLPSNTAFSVMASWPEGLQAITNAARVGVVLDGLLYRNVQH